MAIEKIGLGLGLGLYVKGNGFSASGKGLSASGRVLKALGRCIEIINHKVNANYSEDKLTNKVTGPSKNVKQNAPKIVCTRARRWVIKYWVIS